MTEINDIKQAIEDYANGKTANFSNKQFIKWISSLITTIESQKEEIEQLRFNLDIHVKAINEQYDYKSQFESLKAITEIAVKGLEDAQYRLIQSKLHPWRNNDALEVIEKRLAKIKRLSNT